MKTRIFNLNILRCSAYAGVMLAVAVSVPAGAQTSGNQTDQSTPPSNQSSITAPTAPTPKYSSAWLSDKVVTYLNSPADRLSFAVTNKTKDTIKYDFNSGQQYDFVVTDTDGKEIWTWSKDQTFSPLITHLNLRSGRTHTYTVIWNRRDDNQKPVPPGVYTVTASLQTLPRLAVSQSSTLNVSREDQDPTNVGLQSPPGSLRDPNSAQNGVQVQSDTSPSVSAKTTITIVP